MHREHEIERAFARVVMGDQEAMGVVIDLAYASLVDDLAGTGELDELIRRTFVEVWRTAPRADLRRGVTPWILGVARSLLARRAPPVLVADGVA